jgi:hypothetical protein
MNFRRDGISGTLPCFSGQSFCAGKQSADVGVSSIFAKRCRLGHNLRQDYSALFRLTGFNQAVSDVPLSGDNILPHHHIFWISSRQFLKYLQLLSIMS